MFQDKPCSAPLFKTSGQDFSIDAAEHRTTLKNTRNTYYLRFSATPKTGRELPETGVLFFSCVQSQYFPSALSSHAHPHFGTSLD